MHISCKYSFVNIVCIYIYVDCLHLCRLWYCMYIVCILYVYCMYIVCILYVYCMYKRCGCIIWLCQLYHLFGFVNHPHATLPGWSLSITNNPWLSWPSREWICMRGRSQWSSKSFSRWGPGEVLRWLEGWGQIKMLKLDIQLMRNPYLRSSLCGLSFA